MEAIANFGILFIFYFLGSMALVQLAIKPLRKVAVDSRGNRRVILDNQMKILISSIFLSALTTTLAYLVFP